MIDKYKLKMFKDLEENLKCAGFCHLPDFWFHRSYYEGRPSKTCLNSLYDQLDEIDSYLGFSFLTMALFNLFQLFSICGICKSKDRSFQKELNPHESSRNALYLDDDKSHIVIEQMDMSSYNQTTNMAMSSNKKQNISHIRFRNYQIE